MVTKLKESHIERRLVERTREAKGVAFKFVSPARRSVPDRLILLPVPEEHRALVASYLWFVECKAPGQKPTESQSREHERLRDLGYRVDVVDTYDAVDETLAPL